jgi:uncharacterized protein DUF2784
VLWAHLVAVVHGLAVVLMLTGALVALRRPRLLWVHAPVAAAILAVNLAGAPCPLTDLELALREGAGGEPYTGGFLGHYALAPVGLDVASPAVQAGIYTVALVPNVLGYGLLTARGLSRCGVDRAGTVVSARDEATLPAQLHAPLRAAGISPRSAPAGSPRCGPRARARRC